MADGVQSGVGVVSTARARAGDWVLYDGRDHWRDARAVRRDLVGDLSLRSKTPVSWRMARRRHWLAYCLYPYRCGRYPLVDSVDALLSTPAGKQAYHRDGASVNQRVTRRE